MKEVNDSSSSSVAFLLLFLMKHFYSCAVTTAGYRFGGFENEIIYKKKSYRLNEENLTSHRRPARPSLSLSLLHVPLILSFCFFHFLTRKICINIYFISF